MIRDVQALKSCDSAVFKYDSAVARLKEQNQKAEEVIEIRTKERDLLSQENEVWMQRYANQEAERKEQEQNNRRKVRRLSAVVVGQAVLVVLLVL